MAISSISPAFVILALASVLTGCNSGSGPAPSATAPTPSASYQSVPAGVTPPNFSLPSGSGCQGAVARWAAIQDNDLKSGHVSPSVYKTIQGEIAQARAACNAGRDAEARGMVRASRARHGYPAG